MEYRILGPLTVTRDGEPVALTGRHQPRLLAALLLAAGQTVTVARLTEVLWDRQPPMTAHRQVRNYMAALRRSLGPPAITVAAEGYALVTETAWIDSLRFEDLTTTARADVRAGRLDTALTALDEAVSLWRGEVLSGLSGRFVEPAAAGWRERWLSAIEERAEIRLALGRHAEVADQLPEVLARWPSRQRLCGHLMLALYRCGRPDAAAAVYRDLRERLSDELGIDPNPLLRDRYDKIRRADRELDGVEVRLPEVEPGDEAVVPAQLPADIATFTGRSSELSQLDRLLDGPGAVGVVSAVSGGGGIGKTALAVHWGLSRRDRFPDGQLYINLRGFDTAEPVRPIEALSRLLRALGLPGDRIPSDPDQAAARYRETVSRRRVLTILDNARSAEQVRPLLPGPGSCTTVITSRDRMPGLAVDDDTLLIGLPTLSADEALDLLRRLLGPERVGTDPDASRRLVELCGRLPLALRIAAANLSSRDGTDIADHVVALDGAGRLDRLAIDGDPRAAVTATFALSVGALDAETRELFLRLGLIPGDEFATGLAVEVGGHDEPRTVAMLRRLVSAHLLEAHRPGRYRFHDLVRLFARQRATAEVTAADRKLIDDRILEWHFENRRRFTAEDIANVIAVCHASREHPRMWRAAMALGYAAELGTGQRASHDCCRIALRLAEQHGDVTGQAKMLSVLGALAHSLGDMDRALELSRRAVALGRAHLDRAEVGALCVGLSVRLIRHGLLHEAEQRAREALRAVGPVGTDNRVHAVVRSLNLAHVYRALGRYPEAEKHLDQAADAAGDAQSFFPYLGTLICRATMHNDQGLFGRAWEYAGEALTLAERKRSYRQQVVALQQLGRSEVGLGNVARARALFERSGEISRRHHLINPEKQAHALLAELASDLADQTEAREHMSRLAAVDDGQAGPVELAEIAYLTALIQVRTGQYESARRLGRDAVERYRAMPYPLRHAQALAVLAEAHGGLGHHTQAERCRRQSHTVFRRLGIPVAGTPSDARPR